MQRTGGLISTSSKVHPALFHWLWVDRILSTGFTVDSLASAIRRFFLTGYRLVASRNAWSITRGSSTKQQHEDIVCQKNRTYNLRIAKNPFTVGHGGSQIF